LEVGKVEEARQGVVRAEEAVQGKAVGRAQRVCQVEETVVGVKEALEGVEMEVEGLGVVGKGAQVMVVEGMVMVGRVGVAWV